MLRKASCSDIPMLCKARKKQLIDEGLSADANIDAELTAYFEKTLADGTLIEWLVEEDGQVVATDGLALMPFPPTYTNPAGTRGYVTNMYTAPSYRGRGLATQLMGKLFDEAKALGIKKLLLHGSEMGRPVYRRQGFQDKEGWMELDL